MATYSGEEYSLMTVANMSPNCWDGRWEFSLSEISSGRYAYSISIYLRLVPGKRASNYRNTWGDYATAHYEFYIPEVGVNEVTYGPYRVVGGQGWTKYLATISGEFTVSGKTTIRPGFGVMSGYGRSEGTGLYAVDTWWCGCGEYEVIGIKPAVPSNPRCTAKTSSSITMTFDIDWGNEPENGTRDPACTLLDANHNEIRVIRNGTSTGTFTGLSRYTPYYIRGYACNSQGGGYTNEVLVYTNPENPTISKPVISNLGRLTATVTPGKVTDDGGKAITEIETYIKGGAYGDTLTSIGKGSGAKNLTGLQPNTTYKVITRATNGITESYSAYETFTTLGNPPTITDVYASTVSTTGATITYTATYDHNAKFSQYKIQWRYPGSTTWTDISISNNKITGVSNLNTDVIEYRITVTDNWNRSTTSKVLTYRMTQNLSNEISELNIVTNSDGTYTISATWSQKVYNKIEYAYILGVEDKQQREEIIGNPTLSNTGITVRTKAYKNKKTNKTFYLMVKLSSFNWYIGKNKEVKGEPYEKAITLLKNNKLKDADISAMHQMQVQNPYTEIKTLRRHDIIKLSRKIRYIYIDSRGTIEDKINIINETFEVTTGNVISEISIRYNHISGPLYQYNISRVRLKTKDGRKLRIRNGGWLITAHNITHYIDYDLELNGTYQIIDTSTFGGNLFKINDSGSSYNFKSSIAVYMEPEFDFARNSASKTITAVLNYSNSDVVNNHLLEIQVFDNNNNNISAGKPVKLSDNSNPICPYGTTNLSATNGVVNNPQLAIYSNNGLPLVLDLGKEYIISKIKIWRKYRANNPDNKYSRNYIIGRNENKEICYIFYDSDVNDTYLESSNGKEFIIK